MKSFRIRWRGPQGGTAAEDPVLQLLQDIRSAIGNQTVILQEIGASIPHVDPVKVEQIRLLLQSIADNTSVSATGILDIHGLVQQLVDNPAPPAVVFQLGDVHPLAAGFNPLETAEIMSGIVSTVNGSAVPVEITSVKDSAGRELFDYIDWEYYVVSGSLRFSFLKLPPYRTGATDSLSVTAVQNVEGGAPLTFDVPVDWPLDHLSYYRQRIFVSEISQAAPVIPGASLAAPNFAVVPPGFLSYYDAYDGIRFDMTYFGTRFMRDSHGMNDMLFFLDRVSGEAPLSDFLLTDGEESLAAFVIMQNLAVFTVDNAVWKLGINAVFRIRFVLPRSAPWLQSAFFFPELLPSYNGDSSMVLFEDDTVFAFNTYPPRSAFILSWPLNRVDDCPLVRGGDMEGDYYRLRFSSGQDYFEFPEGKFPVSLPVKAEVSLLDSDSGSAFGGGFRIASNYSDGDPYGWYIIDASVDPDLVDTYQYMCIALFLNRRYVVTAYLHVFFEA